jgi:hypothetical protein
MKAILSAGFGMAILGSAVLAEEAAPQPRAELSTTRIFFGPSEEACVEPQRRHESLLAEVALLVGRAVLPPLIGTGAQKAADYFDRLAGRSSSTPVIISRGAHLYRLDAADQVFPHISCVSIVRGRFNQAPTPTPATDNDAPGPVEPSRPSSWSSWILS